MIAVTDAGPTAVLGVELELVAERESGRTVSVWKASIETKTGDTHWI